MLYICKELFSVMAILANHLCSTIPLLHWPMREGPHHDPPGSGIDRNPHRQ